MAPYISNGVTNKYVTNYVTLPDVGTPNPVTSKASKSAPAEPAEKPSKEEPAKAPLSDPLQTVSKAPPAGPTPKQQALGPPMTNEASAADENTPIKRKRTGEVGVFVAHMFECFAT